MIVLTENKCDAIVCHVGKNDLPHNVNTIENLQKLVDKSRKSRLKRKIAISSAFIRLDKPNIGKQIPKLNGKLKTFCEENLITYIDNISIDESCLGNGKFHPNKKGKAFFAKNLINFVESVR